MKDGGHSWKKTEKEGRNDDRIRKEDRRKIEPVNGMNEAMGGMVQQWPCMLRPNGQGNEESLAKSVSRGRSS